MTYPITIICRVPTQEEQEQYEWIDISDWFMGIRYMRSVQKFRGE